MTSSQAEFDRHSHWFTESSLTESSRSGDCLICSNLVHSERQMIHSFLWEGMMSSQARTDFLEGGGFCPRHFWIAKRIEEDEWPSGGIGVAILCESIVAKAIQDLPNPKELSRRPAIGPFREKPRVEVSSPGSDCIFCRDQRDREESLVEILEFLKHKPGWSEKLAQSPLCVRHALMAFRMWREPVDKLQLRTALDEYLCQLQTDLKEFIRKHDWNYRHEPLGREKNAVIRAIQALTGLARQFPVQKFGAEGGNANGTRER